MKKFEVGDRVRVYFGSQKGIAVRNATVENPATQESPKGEPGVWVCLDNPVQEYDCDGDFVDVDRMWVHTKQCRKLKPKEKRVERWMCFDKDTGEKEFYAYCKQALAPNRSQIHLVELRESEAIVSRDALANALRSRHEGWGDFKQLENMSWFKRLCKELGLETKERK